MQTKLIFSPQLAQWLLHNGYTIVELKPKRDYERETVFVFKVEPGFDSCIETWIGEKEDYDYNGRYHR